MTRCAKGQTEEIIQLLLPLSKGKNTPFTQKHYSIRMKHTVKASNTQLVQGFSVPYRNDGKQAMKSRRWSRT